MADYESKIERKVCTVAMQMGVFSLKLRGIERGWPDRMFLIPGGRPLFIEFKSVGAEPSAYQRLIHERLQYANYQIQVHDSAERAIAAIREAVDA